jgi:hypothetical protein
MSLKKTAFVLSCMAGICGVLLAGALYAQEDPDVIIQERCATEWPHNARMRAACVEQQEKVLDKSLSSPVDPRLPLQDHTLLREKCARDWPDDFRKRAQCEQYQIRGFQKLQAPPPKDVTLKDYSIAVAQCGKEWPDDFRMRARCMEEQIAEKRMHRERE